MKKSERKEFYFDYTMNNHPGTIIAYNMKEALIKFAKIIYNEYSNLEEIKIGNFKIAKSPISIN